MWIIVEEYEPDHIEETLTNVLPYWYETRQDACEAIRGIARDLSVHVEPDVLPSKILVPPERGIRRDTYQIMELQRG